MRAFTFGFRLFKWMFELTFDMYPVYPHPPRTFYGSTSNFGKWKTAPMGHPAMGRKLARKRKRK